MRIKIQTVTMSYQRKLNCPICKYPRLANLNDKWTKMNHQNEKKNESNRPKIIIKMNQMY